MPDSASPKVRASVTHSRVGLRFLPMMPNGIKQRRWWRANNSICSYINRFICPAPFFSERSWLMASSFWYRTDGPQDPGLRSKMEGDWCIAFQVRLLSCYREFANVMIRGTKWLLGWSVLWHIWQIKVGRWGGNPINPFLDGLLRREVSKDLARELVGQVNHRVVRTCSCHWTIFKLTNQTAFIWAGLLITLSIILNLIKWFSLFIFCNSYNSMMYVMGSA